MLINDFFKTRIKVCVDAGLSREHIILDPGFGFGKTVTHNLQIIKCLKNFKEFKLPIMLGVSRKSTIGTLLHKPVNERLIGGVALTTIAALNGVDIIRTHDVEETRQALQIVAAITE